MFTHVNLVRKICWSFHRSTGIDWKELFSEACLAYAEVIGLRDPKKGAETTWIYHCVQSRLINFCKQEKQQRSPVQLDWYEHPASLHKDILEEYTHLSEDSREIIKMVLENSLRYAITNPRLAVVQIRWDLYEQKGWPWPRVWKAMKVLKKELDKPQRTVWMKSPLQHAPVMYNT
jgi:hypothetical protein